MQICFDNFEITFLFIETNQFYFLQTIILFGFYTKVSFEININPMMY